ITSKKHNLIIQGEGLSPVGGVLVPDPTKTIIDARGIDRAFQIDHTLTKVTFRNLTIQGGLALDDGMDGRQPGISDALGGAILAEECQIVLDNVIIQNNKAHGGFGAAGGQGSSGEDGHNAKGGGVYAFGGTVALSDVQIRANEAFGGKGGTGGTGIGSLG